jgi:predicted site-specific integrase-resolvase
MRTLTVSRLYREWGPDHHKTGDVVPSIRLNGKGARCPRDRPGAKNPRRHKRRDYHHRSRQLGKRNFQIRKMKVRIYARVSTDKQTHDSQLQELRRYCEQRGWPNVQEVIDTASGAKSSRRGLDRLMAGVRRGKVDVVLCFKLDRLGRSLAHLAQLISEFQTHGVALVCPGQGIDTTQQNPAAQLQLGILCAVAEFEGESQRGPSCCQGAWH